MHDLPFGMAKAFIGRISLHYPILGDRTKYRPMVTGQLLNIE